MLCAQRCCSAKLACNHQLLEFLLPFSHLQPVCPVWPLTPDITKAFFHHTTADLVFFWIIIVQLQDGRFDENLQPSPLTSAGHLHLRLHSFVQWVSDVWLADVSSIVIATCRSFCAHDKNSMQLICWVAMTFYCVMNQSIIKQINWLVTWLI